MDFVWGEYNASRYVVFVHREGEESIAIYQAGNSPWESQGYLDPEGGVGLETMAKYCEISTRAQAKELNLHYGGVQQMEEETP